MAWRFCLTNTCFALLPNVYSSMVPGNLPSQLEILSTGQNYYEAENLVLGYIGASHHNTNQIPPR